MMTVPRFEKIKKEIPYEVKIESRRSILIKDHKTDKIAIVVNLMEKQEENLELADELIAAIENYLDSE